MAITRTALTDDDGSGTTGTVINNALKTELYDQIDAAITAATTAATAADVDAGLCEGRLTLTSGTPITTSDVTGATNVYWTPYQGNRIALYDGAAWSAVTFTELTLALGTLVNGQAYDVFAYSNAGVATLELLEWKHAT